MKFSACRDFQKTNDRTCNEIYLPDMIVGLTMRGQVVYQIFGLILYFQYVILNDISSTVNIPSDMLIKANIRYVKLIKTNIRYVNKGKHHIC